MWVPNPFHFLCKGVGRLDSQPRAQACRSNPIRQPDDGTRQLLQWGGAMLGAGLVAALLLVTLLGGFTATGATPIPAGSR